MTAPVALNAGIPVIDLNADPLAAAAWIVKFLKARGVDRVFGLQGGHIQPIWDFCGREGIRIVDVRDEGAAVHPAGRCARCPAKQDEL